jgi:CheY-like chemotaxis protein
MSTRMTPILVLLAEDNAGDIFLVREALRTHQLHYALRILSDGEQAAEYLNTMGNSPESPCPDIFLVDLNLPKASGHELLKTFKDRCNDDVPVVVMTSSDAPWDRTRASELGAARFFRKPSGLDEFLELGALVKELVEGQPAA